MNTRTSRSTLIGTFGVALALALPLLLLLPRPAVADLLVSSYGTHQVLRYDSSTGAFLGAFVSEGSGGLFGPVGLTFGPDGNLYVSDEITSQVLRYDGSTGAFLDARIEATVIRGGQRVGVPVVLAPARD